MAIAASRIGKIKVCATDGSYTELLNVNSIDASGFDVATRMDNTMMGDTAKRTVSSGYYNTSLTVNGNYEAADAGMVILEANLGAVWVQYLPSGTSGFKQQMSCVLKKSPKAGDGPMTFTATFEACGGAAPTSV